MWFTLPSASITVISIDACHLYIVDIMMSTPLHKLFIIFVGNITTMNPSIAVALTIEEVS